jgi:Ser/Thr protein kinase RdoA (MazF antagonist)
MEEACFSARAPEAIWRNLSSLVERLLDAEPVAVFHYSVSIGAVLGLELSDGRRVALKVFAPWHDPAFLAGVNEVRRHLLADGYPAPLLLAGVESFGAAHAWIEEWFEAPPPTSTIEMIGPLAAHLADFLQRTAALQGDAALSRSWQTYEQPIGIWRNPPRPDADLNAAVPDADWVQAIAELGRSIGESAPGPRVIGHIDWRPDNVRIRADGTLAVVYDWDSVQHTHRVHILAGACVSLSPDGMCRFLSAYDAENPGKLTGEERRAVAGRVIWSRAALARFELVRQIPTADQRFVPNLQRDLTQYLDAAKA